MAATQSQHIPMQSFSNPARSHTVSTQPSSLTSTLPATKSPMPSVIPASTPLGTVTKLLPPTGQFIINTLLQIAGFIAAIAFGIYAVQSVTVGKDGNQFAYSSNQLAMIGFCLTTDNQTGPIASICSRVVYHASTMLPNVASSLFPNLPTLTPSPTSSATGSMTTLPPTSTPISGGRQASSSTALAGIIAGVTIGAAIFIGTIIMCCMRRRKAKSYTSMAPTTASAYQPESASTALSQRRPSRSLAQRLQEFFVETRVITDARGK